MGLPSVLLASGVTPTHDLRPPPTSTGRTPDSMEAAIAGQESESSASDLLRLDAPPPGPSGKHRFMACCGCTAMLLDGQAEPRVSTGLDALDEVLGGLYWGDNVVWRLDRAPLEPFYRAIASTSGTFETRAAVSVGNAVNTYGVPGLAIMDAGAGPPACSTRSGASAGRKAAGSSSSSRSTAW